MAQGRVFYFAMLVYSKPFLSLADQIQLIQSRGLEISDSQAASDCLQRIGYYRLSGYWYPFRAPLGVHPPTRSDQFLPGSRLEDVVSLYVFDKKLKLILLDALERVEIAVRVEIALRLGNRSPTAYQEPRFFDSQSLRVNAYSGKSRFNEWNEKFDGMVARSHDDFVRHYQAKYQMPLPIWMAIELWDFGLLSRFYALMLISDRREVTRHFGIPDWKLLQSWLRALNHVRNIIAHHGRIWNRTLVDYPTLPRQGVIRNFDVLLTHPNIDKKIYTICCVLQWMLNTINPNSEWKSRLIAHIDSFPSMPHAQISDMGFPPKWKQHNFWK